MCSKESRRLCKLKTWTLHEIKTTAPLLERFVFILWCWAMILNVLKGVILNYWVVKATFRKTK